MTVRETHGRIRKAWAVTALIVGFAIGTAAPSEARGSTLCWWGQGFAAQYDFANGGPHSWTHSSNWRTWSNPNAWLGRRLFEDNIWFEYYAPYGGYYEFTNASNNWRRTTMHGFQYPYNPGMNWRWEQRSTIGC